MESEGVGQIRLVMHKKDIYILVMDQVLQKFGTARSSSGSSRSKAYQQHSDKLEFQNLKIIFVNPDQNFELVVLRNLKIKDESKYGRDLVAKL